MDVREIIEPTLIMLKSELLENQIEVKYPYRKEQWLSNKDSINEALSTIVGNVYCIFIQPEGSEPIAVYVGQRESKAIRQRLRDHLFKKNEQTGSKLGEVKVAVDSGHKIYINAVKIEPEYMRHALEKMITEDMSGVLTWNKHKK